MARALRWLEEKAPNADGVRPAHGLVAPTSIEAGARLMEARTGPLSIELSRKKTDGWPLLVFRVQNAMAGLGCAALALRHGVSTSTASRYVRAHRDLVIGNEQYADACRLVAAEALVRCHARARVP